MSLGFSGDFCFCHINAVLETFPPFQQWILFFWNETHISQTLNSGPPGKICKSESLMLGSCWVLSTAGFKHERLRLNSWSWTFSFYRLACWTFSRCSVEFWTETCWSGGLGNLNCPLCCICVCFDNKYNLQDTFKIASQTCVDVSTMQPILLSKDIVWCELRALVDMLPPCSKTHPSELPWLTQVKSNHKSFITK